MRRFGELATATFKRLLRKLRSIIYETGEFRVYRLAGQIAIDFQITSALRVNDPDHVKAYSPDEPWHLDRNAFIRDVNIRMANRHAMYSTIANGRLSHWSWLTFPAIDIECDLGFASMSLPPNAARLWDDNTIRSARGQGLQFRSIRHRARDAALAGAQWLYIGVRADNAPSRRNIEKAGFELFATMHYRRVLMLRKRRVVCHDANSPT